MLLRLEMCKKTKITSIAFLFFAWILLSACQSKAGLASRTTQTPTVTSLLKDLPSGTPFPTSTSTFTSTPSPTLIPSDTPTPTLTPLPTETPTPSLTPVPWSAGMISTANASEIIQLAMWGRGRPLKMEITPDGERLVVQTPLGLYVYEFSTLNEIAFFEGAQQFLVSPDGQFLAVSYPGVSTVELWGFATSQTLYQLGYLPPGEVTAMAFNRTGSLLAVGCSDSHISLWDLRDGSLSQELEHPIVHAVTNIVFSPNGTKLATNSRGRGVIGVWSLTESKLLWRTANGGQLSVNSFTPDSKTLITVGLLNSKVMFWDVEEGLLLITFGAANLQEFIGYSKDGLNLIVYGVKAQSGTEFLELRSMQDGELLDTLEIPGDYAVFDFQYRSLFVLDESGLRRFVPATWGWTTISNDTGFGGEILTSSSGDGVAFFDGNNAQVWSASTGETLMSVSYQNSLYAHHLLGSIDGVKWMPDKQIVAWGRSDSALFWWYPLSETLERLSLDDWPSNHSAFSPRTGILAVCTENSLELVKIFDQSRESYDRCRKSGYLAFSPDGGLLARSTVLVVDLLHNPDWGMTHTLYGHTLPVEIIAYSPSGHYIASGTSVDRGGSEVAIWRTDPPSQLMQFIVPSYGIDSLAFSWDDKLLATGGGGTQVRLWRISDGWLLDSLDLNGGASSLAFSLDNKILAVGTDSGDIYFFDVTSSAVLHMFGAHKGGVIGLEFSPDGRNLLSISDDGTVRLWGLP